MRYLRAEFDVVDVQRRAIGQAELIAGEAPAGREPDKPLPLTSEVADTSQSVNEERGLGTGLPASAYVDQRAKLGVKKDELPVDCEEYRRVLVAEAPKRTRLASPGIVPAPSRAGTDD